MNNKKRSDELLLDEFWRMHEWAVSTRAILDRTPLDDVMVSVPREDLDSMVVRASLLTGAGAALIRAQFENVLIELRATLALVLDQVDYTQKACTPEEMVGAVLPREVLTRAHAVLEKTRS
jgi:hypothetical protein